MINKDVKNLLKMAKGAEIKLENSKLKYNTDLIDYGISVLSEIFDRSFFDEYDIEPDGVNVIEPYDDMVDERQMAVKYDVNNAPAVNDLAWLYNHDFFDYVYVNGYDRIEPVSCDDVACELSDVIDYINDKLKDAENNVD